MRLLGTKNTVDKSWGAIRMLQTPSSDGVFSCLLFINMFYNMLITCNQAKEKT